LKNKTSNPAVSPALKRALILGVEFIQDNLDACPDCPDHVSTPPEKCSKQCQDDIEAIKEIERFLADRGN
jgi:hypothetical protein